MGNYASRLLSGMKGTQAIDAENKVDSTVHTGVQAVTLEVESED